MELQLRQSLFWDVDVQTIDLQKHRKSVIERILLRASFDEFCNLLKYYGKETVRDTLLQVRYLDKKHSLFAVRFLIYLKQISDLTNSHN